MDVRYPELRFDLRRDAFVVWVRWVSMESPPSPDDPPRQGIRVELLLNRNPVLGPTIVSRRDLEPAPLYLRANRARVTEILSGLPDGGPLDITLVIHGSIANAPYMALFVVRDDDGAAIETRPIQATPLLQLQPSTPSTQWHCAGQASVRLCLSVDGRTRHLDVVH